MSRFESTVPEHAWECARWLLLRGHRVIDVADALSHYGLTATALYSRNSRDWRIPLRRSARRGPKCGSCHRRAPVYRGGLCRECFRTREREKDRANPLPRRERSAKRHALRLATTCEPVDYVAVLREYGLHCYLCDEPIEWAALSFDHVEPLAGGGAHAEVNLRPTHLVCNLRKGTRSAADYLAGA